MSNLIVPDDAKIRLTKLATSISLTGGPDKYRLFQNNVTPDHNTTSATLTEATFSGYTSGGVALSGGAVSGSLDGSGRAVATWNSITYTKSGATGNTIYGYYCVDSSGNLLWVERFDSPIAMTTDGSFITLVPKFTGMSQYSNT